MARTKFKFRIHRDLIPEGWEVARALNDDNYYFVKVREGVSPKIVENWGCLEVRESVEVSEKMSLGDEERELVHVYTLSNNYEPPFTAPCFEIVAENEKDYNVIRGGNPIFCSHLEVYEEVLSYIRKHIWFMKSNQGAFYALASFVLATWLPQDIIPLQSYTYLSLLGPYGTGKTRVLEVLEQVCYRGCLTPSITAAGLARIIHYFKATVLIDESQLLHGNDRQQLVALLNQGYRAHGRYIVADREDPSKIRSYNVGGFKAFGAPLELVRSLETRCLEIEMTPLVDPKAVRFYVDRDGSKVLRAMLYNFRINNFSNVNIPNLEYLANELFDAGLKDRRLVEILVPIYIATPIEYREKLLKFFLRQYLKKREESASSFEAVIIQAIINCEDITREYKGMKLLRISEITNEVNNLLEITDKRNEIKPQSIGARIKVFGFAKTRDRENYSCIVYDYEKIARWAVFYGLECPPHWFRDEEFDENISLNNFKLSELSENSDKSLYLIINSKLNSLKIENREKIKITVKNESISESSEASENLQDTIYKLKNDENSKNSIFENRLNDEDDEMMKKAKQRVLEIMQRVKQEHFGAILDDLISQGYCDTPLQAEQVIKELINQGLLEVKCSTLIYRE